MASDPKVSAVLKEVQEKVLKEVYMPPVVRPARPRVSMEEALRRVYRFKRETTPHAGQR